MPDRIRAHQHARRRGFTLLEAAVVLVVLVVGATLLFLMMHTNGGYPISFQSTNQMRGIIQSLVIYSQSNSVLGSHTNAGYYPGLNPDGTDAQLAVEERFQTLIDADSFHPEYMMNPVDSVVTEWQHGSGPVQPSNYSYALLQIPAQGARRAEWQDTLNSSAVVIADRNTDTPAAPSSVWSQPGQAWEGAVGYNDGHTAIEKTHLLDTEYAGVANKDDHLFEAVGDDDALLIHSGN